MVAAIVEEVKACGGNPFVCDTTTVTYHLFNSRCTGALIQENAVLFGIATGAGGYAFASALLDYLDVMTAGKTLIYPGGVPAGAAG